jgi:hypothetical protein
MLNNLDRDFDLARDVLGCAIGVAVRRLSGEGRGARIRCDRIERKIAEAIPKRGIRLNFCILIDA